MNIVFHTHPAWLGLRSQDSFADLLLTACRRRGHAVSLRRPDEVLHRRLPRGPLAKWAGYVDQYLLFPRRLRQLMRADPLDTLYVFCDQALGPWIAQVADRPHVVHCHDLLALRSALGQIPEHRTGLTGRIYQRWIRAGYRRARHFISISERTRQELHRLGGVSPRVSEVVHNGLNHPYRPLPRDVAAATLREAGLPVDVAGCLLHVGGGQWYKNSVGVVRLYAAYVEATTRRGETPLVLWMVSPAPDAALRRVIDAVPAPGEVRFFQGLSSTALEAAYGHARALLFPSLAEGFGWPVLEAMACGCPVLTTGEAPMTEVGGDVAHYLPRLKAGDDVDAWASSGAGLLARVLARPVQEQAVAAQAAIARAARFSEAVAVDRYLEIYSRVLALERPALPGSVLACP